MCNRKPDAWFWRNLDYFKSILVVTVCSVASVALQHHLVLTDLAMIYLLGVFLVSVRYRRSAAVLNAILSVAAFDYWCVPSDNSFIVRDSENFITLGVMLVVALVTSHLIAKGRSQAAAMHDAEIKVQAERMRNAMLSAVSHDIKTPLTAIYGAATSLLEEESRLGSSERHDLAESIAEEAERLNRFVTNVLEMTRLEAGFEVKKDWYPLEEIVGSALTRFEKALNGRPVQVSIPQDLPLICVDDVLMQEVFINLLDNFVKYTPPATALEIEAKANGKRVSVILRDAGGGFPQGEENRIFEKFFRGKTGGVRGAGLGLTICRAILIGHHGNISAANAVGGGAILHLELPIEGKPPQVGVLPEGALT